LPSNRDLNNKREGIREGFHGPKKRWDRDCGKARFKAQKDSTRPLGEGWEEGDSRGHGVASDENVQGGTLQKKVRRGRQREVLLTRTKKNVWLGKINGGRKT